METRKIGSLDVTVVALGCNNSGRRLDQDRTSDLVSVALDRGVNFFDIADADVIVDGETFVGNALRSRRSEALIATKFGDRSGASPSFVKAACDASLSRLGTDYIDLFQLHRPDPGTPITETLGALNELIDTGKVREIGCSNFTLAQLREATEVLSPGQHGFASVQNRFSLLDRSAESDVIPFCRREGIGFIPYQPLFSGLLTGRYRRGAKPSTDSKIASFSDDRQEQIFSDRNFSIVEALSAFAEARGHSLVELAIARLIAEESIVSVIAGASSASQIEANVAAASWTISSEEIWEIDAIAQVP